MNTVKLPKSVGEHVSAVVLEMGAFDEDALSEADARTDANKSPAALGKSDAELGR